MPLVGGGIKVYDNLYYVSLIIKPIERFLSGPGDERFIK